MMVIQIVLPALLGCVLLAAVMYTMFTYATADDSAMTQQALRQDLPDLRLAHLDEYERGQLRLKAQHARNREALHKAEADWQRRCDAVRAKHQQLKAECFLRGEPGACPPLNLPRRPDWYY